MLKWWRAGIKFQRIKHAQCLHTGRCTYFTDPKFARFYLGTDKMKVTKAYIATKKNTSISAHGRTKEEAGSKLLAFLQELKT